MTQPTLLIFIDGLPLDSLEYGKFISQLNRWPVTTCPGFSSNIKAELFAGLNPDDAGFFNEWMYTPRSSLRRWRPLFHALSPLAHVYQLDRVIHKVIGKFLGYNILNIPFRYLDLFDHCGVVAYSDDAPWPTVFSKSPKLHLWRYFDFPAGTHRDQTLFSRVLEDINHNAPDSIFVASADLDHVLHASGVGSESHVSKIIELDNLIEQCFSAFSRIHSDGELIVLSDHGMTNVHSIHAISPTPEENFGIAGENSYIYFIDSTMLRVWTFSPVLRSEIADWLTNLPGGNCLTKNDREEYAISNLDFGEFIYVLDEGHIFTETFWGRSIPQAMHGYHPRTESQHGCFAATYLAFDSGDAPKAIDVHNHLLSVIVPNEGTDNVSEQD